MLSFSAAYNRKLKKYLKNCFICLASDGKKIPEEGDNSEHYGSTEKTIILIKFLTITKARKYCNIIRTVSTSLYTPCKTSESAVFYRSHYFVCNIWSFKKK